MARKNRPKNLAPKGTIVFKADCGCQAMINSQEKYFGTTFCDEHRKRNTDLLLPLSHRLLMMIEEIFTKQGEFYQIWGDSPVMAVDWDPNQYNPDFGDGKLCTCGHIYYRHFDTYEKMAPVGCKYAFQCQCSGFKEATS